MHNFTNFTQFQKMISHYRKANQLLMIIIRHCIKMLWSKIDGSEKLLKHEKINAINMLKLYFEASKKKLSSLETSSINKRMWLIKLHNWVLDYVYTHIYIEIFLKIVDFVVLTKQKSMQWYLYLVRYKKYVILLEFPYQIKFGM